MKKIVLLTASFILFGLLANAQKSKDIFLQNVRGKVIDTDTKLPLIGATIKLKNSDPLIGTVTDDDGNYFLESIPVGRIALEISYIGYESKIIGSIQLVSAKEKVLNIELVENTIQMEDIVVRPDIEKNISNNQFSMVSSRRFLAEETNLYAGSIGDPARMVGNYAGVMSVNDSRNDIIIRGNSPQGLLWRVDGFDIPNPNHYSVPGSTGGPLSMLNNNNLANSDFITGAFPAEYGNALSGVFDLKLRNGNTSKREHVFQLATSGFELGTEGPIKREKSSSYLVNYRYSAPEIFDLVGLWDTASVPKYQDLTFKINFPKTKLGHLQIFGMGGINGIIIDSRKLGEDDWTYGLHNTVMTMDNKMAVLGITNTVYLDEKSRWVTKISGQYVDNKMLIDTIISNDEEWLQNKSNSRKIIGTFKTELKNKLNAKNFVDIGLDYRFEKTNFTNEQYTFDASEPEFQLNMDEISNFANAYVQYRHKFTDKLSFTAGSRYSYLITNNTFSVEGRAAIEQKIGNRHSLSLGFGVHSKKQDDDVYFLESYNQNTNRYLRTNEELEMTKSKHYVFAFNSLLSEHLNLKFETYYQNLYDVPVTPKQPEFSMLNNGGAFGSFIQDSLLNLGTGENYGVELTFEKYLNKNYYFLITGSLFESKYKGYDQVQRNTEFNGNYMANALFGVDFKIGKKRSIGLNVKGIYGGGKRKLPIDLNASIDDGKTVYDWNNAFKVRYPDYYRLDARISYKEYHKKHTEEWAIDITNMTNNKSNIINEYYNGLTNSISADYQQGILFNFLFKIYF